jgi:quercetin dioxygenase-like cupin family protein
VLMDGSAEAGTVRETAAEVQDNMVKTTQGYWIHPYASRRPQKRIQPFLFVIRRNEVREHHLAHEGEEFLYVLDGWIRVQVGSEEHVLGPGDALYFDAESVHQVIPVTDEARYLDVFA